MKKNLIALLCILLAAPTLSAQMMPDSTVQVVAYWEVGDRMDYTLLERQYTFDAEHNETQISSSSQTLRFEVVDATDSTYTLALRQDEILSIGDNIEYTEKEKAALKTDTPLLFKTTHLGVLLGIENLDERLEEFRQMLPIYTDAAWRNLTPDQRKNTTRKDLENLLGGLLGTEEALSKSFLDDVTPLFFFHGTRLDTTQVYSYEQDIPGILGDVTITLPTEFRVDPELSDDYSVVIRMETEGDEEQLLPFLRDFYFTIYKQATGATDADYESFKIGYDEGIKKNPVKAFIGQYITEEIHLGSGWPVQWVFDRYVELSQGEQFQGMHVTREIFPEDKIGGE